MLLPISEQLPGEGKEGKKIPGNSGNNRNFVVPNSSFKPKIPDLGADVPCGKGDFGASGNGSDAPCIGVFGHHFIALVTEV